MIRSNALAPSFAQAESRSLLTPILLALAATGIAALVVVHFHPATAVSMQYVHTALLPTHTVYKSDSIVVGPSHAEDVLFIASSLHLVNHMSFPASLDDFTLLLTSPDGSELSTRAVQTSDLPNLQLSFPALKPLLPQPLLRESILAPGQAIDGVVLFSLPLTQLTWNARNSAIVKVDVFHQPSLSQTVPKP